MIFNTEDRKEMINMDPQDHEHFRLLQEVLAFSSEGVLIINIEGRPIFLNEIGRKLLKKDFSPDLALALQIEELDLHHPDGRSMSFEETPIGRALHGEVVPDFIITHLRHNKTYQHIKARATPVKDCLGNIIGAVALFTDETAHLRVENALKESEQKFQDFVRNSEDGVTLIDELGIIVEWNAAQERITGLSSDEVLGEPMWEAQFRVATPDRRTPETRERLKTLILRLTSTAEWSQFGRPQERELHHTDGTRKIVQILLFPIGTGKGYLIGSITRDITEQKKAEEQIKRAQRLEMAGRIAGQVAHDFNNLLSPLAAYPELIKMELPEDHPATRLCNTMLEAVERMAEINDDLLTLSRRGVLNHEPMDLNRLVEQIVEQLNQSSNHPDITLIPDLELLPISGSAAQLSRVVTNLLTNAREASKGSEIVEIRTDNVYLDRQIDNLDHIRAGEYVRLQVLDKGPGIPAGIIDKIFDPFFSTKQANRRTGSGLGLSIVQTIVSDHHGHVTVESRGGRGTIFSVYFPTCRETAANRRRENTPMGDSAILLVDDDELQRDVLSRLLQSQGYAVEAVSSGESAVSYLQEHEVELLIIDLVMPGGIDGVETYRRILQMHPGQKAIVISGYSGSERAQEALALGAGAYVNKPLTLDKLAQAVRQELDRQR